MTSKARKPVSHKSAQASATKTNESVRDDKWVLFEACGRGDIASVKALLAKDHRLVNAQLWYRLPIHMAVFGGHADLVKLLLDAGTDPGQSVYTYDSWPKLLLAAQQRGDGPIESLLVKTMQKRFNYSPEFEPLKEAIIARDARKVRAVLRRKPELVQASDALGNNPLHWSIITRQLPLMEQFIKQGTPINAERADGNTPAMLALGGTDYWYRATRGRSHPSLRDTSVMVGYLLANGAAYSLSISAAVGDQERVEQLLRKAPEAAKRLDSAGSSALSYAAGSGHTHIVRLLLEQGADPNMAEVGAPDGLALFNACQRNDLEMAQLLLEHGANPNAGADSSGCCLTICEVYHGDRAKPMQQLLKQHGAYQPPYAMNSTQMKQAIVDKHQVVKHEEFAGNVLRTGKLDLLEMYLDAEPGALEQLDAEAVVAHPKSLAVIRLLLVRGLDPNVTDWLGNTFLHACADTANRPVAEALLDAGADINAREIQFQGTPLAAAIRAAATAEDAEQGERHRSMIEFLLKRGARTNLPDDLPWATPLAWANRHGRADLADLLTQHGAK